MSTDYKSPTKVLDHFAIFFCILEFNNEWYITIFTLVNEAQQFPYIAHVKLLQSGNLHSW